jgi:hypothetical protein
MRKRSHEGGMTLRGESFQRLTPFLPPKSKAACKEANNASSFKATSPSYV